MCRWARLSTFKEWDYIHYKIKRTHFYLRSTFFFFLQESISLSLISLQFKIRIRHLNKHLEPDAVPV